MLSQKTGLILVCLVALSACQKTTITGISDAQSTDYFRKHPEIGKAVAYKCVDFEQKEYSRLTSGAQKEWQDSTDGINCRNAREAAAWIVLSEQQHKHSEASRKYAVDEVKK
jgi:hypothetical protein